jgi:SAM-dependent methyltransferase
VSLSEREQYANEANLEARIALHARFSTNPGWAEWLFEREAPGAGARILDLGCGPATLWRANHERIDPSWSLTLADSSRGMIEAARRELGERAQYVVADAQTLRFPADSFDVGWQITCCTTFLIGLARSPRLGVYSYRAVHSMRQRLGAVTLPSFVLSFLDGASEDVTQRRSGSKPARRNSKRSSTMFESNASRINWK